MARDSASSGVKSNSLDRKSSTGFISGHQLHHEASARAKKTHQVHAGDVIALFNTASFSASENHAMYVHAEGFSNDRIGVITTTSVHEPPYDYHECLFRISTQLSYSAKKSLHKLKRRGSMTDEQMEYMIEKSEKEWDKNTELLRSCGQRTIHYGQIIQLQHVKSKKFLSFVPRTLAEKEKECIRLSVVENGSEASWFRFVPRYRTRQNGDLVYFDDQVLLQSVKMLDNFVHVSELVFDDENRVERMNRKEVNLGITSTPFRIAEYHRRKAEDSRYLQIGQPLCLFHPEGQSFIHVSTSLHQSKVPFLKCITSADSNAPQVTCSKQVFVIENISRSRGGAVRWGGTYRFRHAATGKYLALVSHDPIITSSSTEQSNVFYRMELRVDDTVASHFRILPSIPRSELNGSIALDQDLGIRIEHTFEGRRRSQVGVDRCWLHNTLLPKSAGSSSVGEMDGEGGNVQLAATPKWFDQDVFNIQLVSGDELADIYRITSTVPMLQSYVQTLEQVLANPIARVTKAQSEPIFRLLKDLVFFFLRNCKETDNPEDCEGQVDHLRQVFARELKLLDGLFWILSIPFAMGLTVDHIQQSQHAIVHRVHKLGYKVIRHIFHDNRVNELYIATHSLSHWMPSARSCGSYLNQIILQLGSKTGAAKTLSCLMSDNRTLLQKNVDDQTITTLLNVLKKVGPEERFVRFLIAICSCQGQAIPKNQEALLRILASGSNEEEYQLNRLHLGIETAIEYATSSELFVSWYGSQDWGISCDYLYYDPKSLELKSVPGLTCTSFMTQYPEEKKRQWVNLKEIAWTLDPEECFTKVYPHFPTWKELNEKGNHESKYYNIKNYAKQKKVVEYYVALIDLFSEMCCNRSYHCIQHFERMFTFDMLFSGMTNDLYPEQLRLSFSKFLVHLYVNRFPHDPIPLPQMIHQSTSKAFNYSLNSSTSSKFTKLTTYFRKYMTSPSLQSPNMTNFFIQIQQQLYSFGLYPTLQQINPFLESLPLATADAGVAIARILDFSYDIEIDMRVQHLLDEIHSTSDPDYERLVLATPSSNIVLDAAEIQKVLFRKLETTTCVSEFQFTLTCLFKLQCPSEFLSQTFQQLNCFHQDEPTKLYQQVQAKLTFLRHQLESIDLWGIESPFQSQINTTLSEKVISTLGELTELASSRSSVFVQNLLRQLHFVPVVLKIVHLPIQLSQEGIKQTPIFQLKKQTNLLVAEFLSQNPTNQHLLFPHLQAFTAQMGHCLMVAPVVANIFNGNRSLCLKVPSSIIRQFATTIEKKGPALRWLNFFESLILANGTPIRRNQEMILRVLTSGDYANVCLLFTDAAYNPVEHHENAREDHPERHRDVTSIESEYHATRGYQQRRQLLLHYDQNPTKRLALDYHAKLIHLLALTCQGKIATAELICQQLLPCELLLTLLLDRTSHRHDEFRQSILYFFYHVYLDTELHASESLAFDGLMWKVLHSLAMDIQDVIAALDADTAAVVKMYLLSHLKIIEHFFTNFYDEKVIGEELEAQVQFIQSTINAFSALLPYHHQEFTFEIQQAAIAAAKALNCSTEALAAAIQLQHYQQEQDYEREKETSEATSCVDGIADWMQSNEKWQGQIQQEFSTLIKHLLLADTMADQLIKQLIWFVESTLASASGIALNMAILRVFQHYCSAVTDFESNANITVLSHFVLDTLAYAKQDNLIIEALNLAIHLLEQNPAFIQEHMFTHLQATKTDRFFRQLHQRIHRAIHLTKHKRKQAKYLRRLSRADASQMSLQILEANKADLTSCFDSVQAMALASIGSSRERREHFDAIRIDLVFRMLQLFGENHFERMQVFIRHQQGFRLSTNLLQDTIDLITSVAKNELRIRHMEEQELVELTCLFDFLIEMCQGPCSSNQHFLSQSTKLIETCKSILQTHIRGNISDDKISELKEKVVIFLESLIEGRLPQDPIYQVLKEQFYNASLGKQWQENQSELLIFMKTLGYGDPEFQDQYQPPHDTREIYSRLEEDVRQIEITWKTQLHPVYFRLPRGHDYFTHQSKLELMDTIDYAADEKYQQFLTFTPAIAEEILHSQYLAQSSIYRFIQTHCIVHLKPIQFALMLTLHWALLHSLGYREDHIIFASPSVQQLVQYLGYGLMLTSTFQLLFLGISRFPVLVKQQKSFVKALVCFGLEPEVWFAGIYWGCCLAGTFLHPLFWCFGLFDLINMSKALQNVVKAIVEPSHALLMTAILTVLVIYVFSLIGFYLFPADLQTECTTLRNCFGSFLYNGLLSGGGIGDYITNELGNRPELVNFGRIGYDLSFFIIVLVLLLNIVFGVILDTFGSLRESLAEKEELMTSKCFICEIEKTKFDQVAHKQMLSSDQHQQHTKGFTRHIKYEHNMWDYLFYLIALRQKDPTDYTGIESYVMECVQADDLRWIPQGQALALEEKEAIQEENETEIAAKELLHEYSENVTTKITSVIEDLSARILELEHQLQMK